MRNKSGPKPNKHNFLLFLMLPLLLLLWPINNQAKSHVQVEFSVPILFFSGAL